MIMGVDGGRLHRAVLVRRRKYLDSGEPSLRGSPRESARRSLRKVETGTNVKELYELENEINQMQDNLLKADEAERVFFQNASHELRTPLMSISGYAQGIQRGVFEDVHPRQQA